MIQLKEREMPTIRIDANGAVHRLAQASCIIHSLTAVKDVLEAITAEARTLIGAHQAKTRMVVGEHSARILQTVSLSDKYAAWRTQNMPTTVGGELDMIVCRANRTVRMTHNELVAHPAWEPWNHATVKQPPMRGWLAGPLTSATGRNFGLIQLTDRHHGDFTASDESLLGQFGRMASVALENAWLHQAMQVANQTLLQRLRGAMLQTEISETLIKGVDSRQSLRTCVESIAHHLNVACGQLWIARGVEALELVSHAGATMPAELSRCSGASSRSAVSRVAATRGPWLTNGLDADSRLGESAWAAREGLVAFAGCPLAIDDDFHGVLAVFDRKPLAASSLDSLSTSARTIAHWIGRNR